jgi:integrase
MARPLRLVPGLSANTRVGPASITFADYFDDYAGRQIWTPQSARTIGVAARSFPERDTLLTLIQPRHVEAWIRSMDDAGLTPNTIRTRVANVRAVLNAAVRDGLVETNPVVGVRLPRTTGRSKSLALPSEAQIARLVASSPEPYNLVFALCAYAGLRIGEARGLVWGDIDFDKGTLTVRRQLQLVPGGGQQAVRPKYDSYRTVPLPQELTTLLAPRRGDASETVVGGPGGAAVHPGSIQRVWSRQKVACGLGSGFRVHDMRHWYASRQIDSGANILTVQRRMGHARASTTLDVYAHAFGGVL